jgi:phosphopantothenoylcysteine synthetase/decarboxylase
MFISDRLLQDKYKIGDPILHIELRRWADVVLVAPCSVNTLAKIAAGLCDNLPVCYFILTSFHLYMI